MSDDLTGPANADIARLRAALALRHVPIEQADEAVAEARREAAGEIARLRAELLEQGRELERWKRADAAALRERLGRVDSNEMREAIWQSLRSARGEMWALNTGVPRVMAAIRSVLDLSLPLAAPWEPVTAQSRPSLLGAWPGNETAEEVIAVIDGQSKAGPATDEDLIAAIEGQTKEDKPHG